MIQWRAVGFDEELNEEVGIYNVFDYCAWRDDQIEAEADEDILKLSEPPFDDVYIEYREVTYGPIKRYN